MAEAGRIQSLERKHVELEHAIEVEEHRPLPDQSAIAALKKQKLHLKDELKQLKHLRYQPARCRFFCLRSGRRYAASAVFLRTYFCTLPVEVFGSGPNITVFGAL